jgi:hypothetical protein
MVKLQRHQGRLGRPHHQHGKRYRHERPKDRMQPERWREVELDPKSQSHDNRAEQQDHTDYGAIPSIMRAKVETAYQTLVANIEQVAEQLTLTAAGTAAGKRGMQQRDRPSRHGSRFNVVR